MAPLNIMKNNTISNHRLNAIRIARHSAYVKSEFGRNHFFLHLFSAEGRV